MDKEAYFDYLTKRLDSGESKNVVVPTAVDLIVHHLSEGLDRVKILDVGCFNGAMLNRIYSNVPDELKDKVKLFGIDCNKDAIESGKNKYKNIEYIYADIESVVSIGGSVDIILFSNVLHELFSEERLSSKKIKIEKVFCNFSHFLNDNGEIVLLDGIKPRNENKIITLKFKDIWGNKFDKLIKEYKATALVTSKIDVNTFSMDVLTLAVFMSKFRYLDKDYWPDEALQLYHYYDEYEFKNMVINSGLVLERFESQFFDDNLFTDIFELEGSEVDIPAKNVLLVAKRKLSDV